MRIWIFAILFAANFIYSQNPITKPGSYFADPEAKVWDNGRLYLYGSVDESEEYWCSHSYDIYSTTNMVDWNVDRQIFSSVGESDNVPGSNKLLWAPDCIKIGGQYLLYFCSPGKIFGESTVMEEGVAFANSPIGPFSKTEQIFGAHGIDPALYVDNDGQGYYFWGQGHPRMAKLNDSFSKIDSTNIVFPLEKKSWEIFHEGTSIRKINDTYYMVFADESRRDRPTCLGYATSDKIGGPYQYKGIIIDNYGSDPQVWNNHGSIQKFNGKWYVFYHRSTNGSRKFRKVCIEPIEINSDGTIDEVSMTSNGAAPPFIGGQRIEAEQACGLNGNVRIEEEKIDNAWIGKLSNIRDGDYAIYRYVDFDKTAIEKMTIKTLGNSHGGQIKVTLDSPEGDLIAKFNIMESDKEDSFNVISSTIPEIDGTRAIY
ncbi:MAG: family 43 glycosylhydrolase, partial [Maribacter sp.]